MRTFVTSAQSIDASARFGTGSFAGSKMRRHPPASETANCPARSLFNGCGCPAGRSRTEAAASSSAKRVLSLRAESAPSALTARLGSSHSFFTCSEAYEISMLDICNVIRYTIVASLCSNSSSRSGRRNPTREGPLERISRRLRFRVWTPTPALALPVPNQSPEQTTRRRQLCALGAAL